MQDRKPKNIVICSDGTGNSAMKGRGTNVFKLYEAIKVAGLEEKSTAPNQIAFYDDGVGTERARLLRAIGGAFGLGLSRNVRQLYAHICRVYEPGDHIFMFGFSRGAFTVRTLVGFLNHQGLPDRGKWSTEQELKSLVRERYSDYRKNYKTAIQSGLSNLFNVNPPPKPVNLFPIRFVGVWDTVDAVGFPIPLVATLWNTLIYRYKFPDNVLSNGVQTACQALALDDQRWTFRPELWDYYPTYEGNIQQVWFTGMHSDVGGGYVRTGLSLTSLKWMLENATKSGLLFGRARYDYLVEGANSAGKMHDSRRGLGSYYRYRPRSVGKLQRQSFGESHDFGDFFRSLTGIGRTDVEPSNLSAYEGDRLKLHDSQVDLRCNDRLEHLPRIHVSVLKRIANQVDGYAPGNFPAHCNIEGLDDETNIKFRSALSDFHKEFNFEQGAISKDSKRKRFKTGDTYMVSMLDFSALRVFARQASQHVFLGSVLVTLVLSIPALMSDTEIRPVSWMDSTPEVIKCVWNLIIPDWLNDKLLRIYLSGPKMLLWTIASGIAAFVISYFARRSLERSYSLFWLSFFSKNTKLRRTIGGSNE